MDATAGLKVRETDFLKGKLKLNLYLNAKVIPKMHPPFLPVLNVNIKMKQV